MSDSAPVSAGVSPGPRTLLVGTALSVRQLHHALATVEPRPQVIGCALPRHAVHTGADRVGCPVLGPLEALDQLLDRHADAGLDQVLISLPLSMRQRIDRCGRMLDQRGLTWRFMPTLGDQLAGRATARAGGLPRGGAVGNPIAAGGPLDLAALIDRTPRPLDQSAIARSITGKVVMITGAGGSIGSELALTVARYRPAKLLLVERAENPLFEIDHEIARVFPDLPRQAVLHDVTRADHTLDLIKRTRPAVIFHAAAHKHVPMMEDHPAEAVENNFYGTRSIADAADRFGVERFVMISTDKAVNPSSVMGATKRLAELYIRHLDRRSACIYSMVRFGNVLGSNASVLTIWARQLQRGGPVTVTHQDMTRYFMTIPEAAGLVLQAGSLSSGGEVFLLDMGEPVRIYDLAHRFVRCQGYEPDVDVEIAVTGVRPGEKLFEELAYLGEDMTPTAHESIRIWQSEPIEDALMSRIITTFDRLREKDGDRGRRWRDTPPQAIVNALHSVLPEMVAAAA